MSSKHSDRLLYLMNKGYEIELWREKNQYFAKARIKWSAGWVTITEHSPVYYIAINKLYGSVIRETKKNG